MTRALTRVLALGLAAGGLTVLTVQAPASADGFETVGSSCGSGGYCVEVTYTGTAAPSGDGGGSAVASVPPLCWYEPWKDPKSAHQYVKDGWNTPHHSGAEWVAAYGTEAEFEKAMKESPDATWYLLNCSIDMTRDPRVADYAGTALTYPTGGFLPRMALLVQPGQQPRPPAVDVEVLRDAAYDSLDIPEPQIQRNPEVAGTQATLVNVDTMFWADGYRDTWDITASVGPVSATVVATAEDYVLTSPAGGQTCTHEQFTTPYAGGDAPAGACAFPFTRASVGYAGGFPVQATATWGATWTGTPGPTAPQVLPPVTTSSTVDVPVDESQALVRTVG